MRISHLIIENFRSIKRIDSPIAQIAALVGPNNAGKSNIINALGLVLGRSYVSSSSFSEGDIFKRDQNADITISLTLDPPAQYIKFKFADPVDIPILSFEYKRYKKGEKAGEFHLEQRCLRKDGKPVLVLKSAPHAGQQRQYEPLLGIPSEIRDSVPLIFIGTNRALKEQLPNARYSLLKTLLEDIDADLQTSGESVERFKTLMEEVMGILRTDKFKELEASIRKNALKQLGLDPTKETDSLDFYFSPFSTMDFYKSLDLMVKEHGFEISATELGEGTQNALVLAILQAFEERRKKGAIILIEEPEMFLHPQMQRSLYQTIREIGKENQVIYTTHSPHFVTVPEYHEVLLVRKGSNGTGIQQSNLPTNEKRKEKLLKELDPERNELFFASRVLFVEGDTEKLSLPEYAKRMNLDLNRVGATIVEVGGKRNLMEFVEIARSFDIPVGFVYDKDSKDFKDKDSETDYNKILDDLGTKDKGLKIWAFDNKYEDALRNTLGEDKYQEMCQQYSGYSKAIKARLIAADKDAEIPTMIYKILKWLANAEENEECPG